MADGPYLDNMRIAISRQQFDGSSTKFTMMMHNDPLNPNGPNEMLFAGQTRVHQRTNILVVGAHWRFLANAIEPSVCGGDAAFCQISLALVFIRPHRSTTYVDVAYRYRPSSMVCRSVYHRSEPCKNG